MSDRVQDTVPARWGAAEGTVGIARLVAQEAVALRVLALVCAWSAVGLVSALLRFTAGSAGAEGESLAMQLLHGWTAGALWVPLTLLIVGLHRRFPFRRGAWRRAFAVHLTASLAVPFIYNLAFQVLLPAAAAEGIGAAALTGYLRWLHITVALYWCLLALDRWWLEVVGAEDASAPGSRRRSRKPMRHLTIGDGERTRVIDTDHIAWIEGAGDYVRIHTDGGSFLASRRLAELADTLDPRTFLRIHRSTIVNLARIQSYRPLGHGDYGLVLRGGAKLKVSRTHGKTFRRRMEAGYGAGA